MAQYYHDLSHPDCTSWPSYLVCGFLTLSLVCGSLTGYKCMVCGFLTGSLNWGFRTGYLVWDFRTGNLVCGFRTGSLVWGFRTGSLVWGFRTGYLVCGFLTGSLVKGFRTGCLVCGSLTGYLVWGFRTGYRVRVSRLGTWFGVSGLVTWFAGPPALWKVSGPHPCVFPYLFGFPFLNQLVVSLPCRGLQKRCRLSWLTNTALVYEPKCGERRELRREFLQPVLFLLYLQQEVSLYEYLVSRMKLSQLGFETLHRWVVTKMKRKSIYWKILLQNTKSHHRLRFLWTFTKKQTCWLWMLGGWGEWSG